jgi:hypothetical protein
LSFFCLFPGDGDGDDDGDGTMDAVGEVFATGGNEVTGFDEYPGEEVLNKSSKNTFTLSRNTKARTRPIKDIMQQHPNIMSMINVDEPMRDVPV